ncbi:MAG: phage head-tail connector protein [Candidatus Peribacteraceae bacterium]|nr:phage head-tail connector protein [Candidatus Peribacteraceae bacterium]
MAQLVDINIIKALGRIDTDIHDTLLKFLLDSAVEFVEDYCAVSLTQKEFIENITPDSTYLWLRQHPIIQILEVLDTYYNDEPVTDTYKHDKSKIYLPLGGQWSYGDKRYNVKFIAGYSENEVPNALNSAIAQLVIRNYNNIDSAKATGSSGINTSWQPLLDSDTTAILDRHTFRRNML